MDVGRVAALWLGACVLVGCGVPYGQGARYNRIRTVHTLENVAGLVLSSSPSVYEEPEPRVRAGQLAFTYALFAENHDSDVAEIDLVAARAMLVPESDLEQPTPFRAACLDQTPGKRAAPIARVPAGVRVRVECTVEIPRAQMNKVHNADREILLGVPVRAGGQSKLVVFQYVLFAGDTR